MRREPTGLVSYYMTLKLALKAYFCTSADYDY